MSVLLTGFLVIWWILSSIWNASANTTFVASEIRVVKQKNIRRCRAILIQHPPLMRVTLGMKYAQTPCWNIFRPSRPPNSTFLHCDIEGAIAIKKSSISQQTCPGCTRKGFHLYAGFICSCMYIRTLLYINTITQ